MLARFLPQSVPFFELLTKQSAILQKQINQLTRIIELSQTKHDIEKQEIQSAKEEIKQLNRTITEHLSRTFITPIDKEDIHAISIGQTHLSCSLYVLGVELFLCGVPVAIPSSLQLLLSNEQSMINEIQKMIKELPNKTDISPNLQVIREKRENGSNLLTIELKKIQQFSFTDFNTIKELLILSKYYDKLELAMEQTINLADTLERTMIKYV